jgi:hypothetical protein
MPAVPRPTRNRQLLAGGLGVHFTSPTKRRNKVKTTTIARNPGHDHKRRKALARLESLLNPSPPSPTNCVTADGPSVEFNDDPYENIVMDAIDNSHPIDSTDPNGSPHPNDRTPKTKRRVLPDAAALKLYQSWKSLLPSLVNSCLAYTTTSMGHLVQTVANVRTSCSNMQCTTKATQITCLYFDRKASLTCMHESSS